MFKTSTRVCTHFKPMSVTDGSCTRTDCAHCEYYSPVGCNKEYYDSIDKISMNMD